jgi:hypothetical protein
MLSDADLLRLLAEDEGYDIDIDSDYFELGSEWTFSSVVPGICRECHATTSRCEPDATHNWCHACEGSTVVSGLELLLWS